MTISVSWANDEKTAVLIKVSGLFSVSEYLEAIEQRKALQSTVPHKSSVIADFSDTSHVPPSTLANLQKAANAIPHPNHTGILVFVGAKGFVFRITKIFAATFGGAHFADTQEEALKMIEKLTNQH